MNPAARNSYKIAVATKDAVLTVESLRSGISGIRYALREKGIQPGDKVIVYTADEFWLISAAWALMQSHITCVPIDPLDPEMDPATIGRNCEARCMILDKASAARVDFPCVIRADNTMPLEKPGWTDEDPGHLAIPYLLYEDNDSLPESISREELTAYYGKLDALAGTGAADRIFLSRCIPFSRMVLDLLWASSRGLTAVIGSLDGDAPLSRYMPSEDRFKMDFSLFYFGSYTESADANKYGLLFDSVRFADRNGFGAVWTPERHFNEFGGLYPNPSLLSAALAMATENVQIRSGSLVSPLHHPARIAEDWSLVDNLSNGRVAISFASGWQCDDFIFYPENYADRHACMLKQIAIVRALWSGEKASFLNGLGKEIDVAIFPKPIQKTLPVWITVSGKIETFIDAGRIGANILTHLLWQNTDELIEKIAAYRRSLRENGFEPAEKKVSVMVHTFLGEGNEVVRDKVREPLKNYIKSSTQLIQSMVKSVLVGSNSREIAGRYGSIDGEIPAQYMDELAELAFARFFDQAGLLGTVEKAQKLLRRLKTYDVDEVACLVDFGIAREEIMNGLTYLTRLKDLYSENEFSRFPVSITHCSWRTIRDAKDNPALLKFLQMQKVLLADAVDSDGIPESLPDNAMLVCDTVDEERRKIIRVEEIRKAAAGAGMVFSAAVSDDF